MKKWIFVLLAALMLVGVGCDSNADKVNKNVVPDFDLVTGGG